MTTSARFFLEIFSCSVTAGGAGFSGVAATFSGMTLADDVLLLFVVAATSGALLLVEDAFFDAVAGLAVAAVERDEADDDEEEFPFRAAALVTAAFNFCSVA